jgi:hypothetical protein
LATVDLGKISFTQKGNYDNSTSYAPKDVVQHTDQNETSSFVKINSTATGQVPQTNGTINSSHWAIFAKGTSLATPNQGTYDASTTYSKGAVVQHTDTGVVSTFLYINNTPASGQTPSTGGTVNSSHWQLIAKGTASVAISWVSAFKTANFTANAAEGYFVDVSSGSVTVTTPASPSVGDEFIIVDARGNAGTNKIFIDGNGSDKIKGSTDNHEIKEDYGSTRTVYSGSTYGWVPVTSNNIDTKSLAPAAYNVQYLVVAGGAGGGGDNGGGGGAGGMRFNSGKDFEVLKGVSYSITVGGGGLGGTNDPPNNTPNSGNSVGASGGNSVFSTITSAGGGGGGSAGNAGASGGSGGGGSQGQPGGSGNTPATDPSQGNNGGNHTNTPGGGAGGGGAGAAASNTSSASAGGSGTANSITGSSVTYAGGGGGGEDQGSSGNAQPGGSGGGGNGSNGGNGNNGTDELGGGGGGGQQDGSARGGHGGDGIVIIRRLTSDSTTTSGTTSTSGTDTIHRFTANGTFVA